MGTAKGMPLPLLCMILLVFLHATSSYVLLPQYHEEQEFDPGFAPFLYDIELIPGEDKDDKDEIASVEIEEDINGPFGGRSRSREKDKGRSKEKSRERSKERHRSSSSSEERNKHKDHNKKKKDDDFVCPSRYGEFPDPKDCSFYYKCENNKAKRKDCHRDKRFDKISNKCIDKKKAICADDQDDHKKVTFKCPYQWGAFGHPEDCSKFFLCLNFKHTIKYCKHGELFDARKRECKDRKDVDCGSKFNPYDRTTIIVPTTTTTTTTIATTRRTTTTPVSTTTAAPTATREPTTQPRTTTTEEPTTTTQTTTEEPTTTTQTTTEEETTTTTPPPPPTTTTEAETTTEKSTTPSGKEIFFCPEPKGRFVYPKDCSKFYRCKEEVATIEQCPKGTLFSTEYGFCYDKNEVDCEDRPRPELYPVCPKPNGKFVKLHTQCRKYYKCKNGVAVESSCPQGEKFSEISRTCDWEELVKCKEDKVGPSVCLRPNGFFPKPKSQCKKYYECTNGVAVEETCPHRELFNAASHRCEWEELVDCKDKVPLDPSCPQPEGTFPVKDSKCTSYVICRGGKPTFLKCPKNRLFDTKRKRCEWYDLVDCQDDQDVTFECPHRCGSFEHPEDCSKFFKCVNYKHTTKNCRHGELFDPKKRECRDKEKVNCGSKFNPYDTTTFTEPTTITRTLTSTTPTSSTTLLPPTTKEPTTHPKPTTTEETTNTTEEPTTTSETTTMEEKETTTPEPTTTMTSPPPTIEAETTTDKNEHKTSSPKPPTKVTQEVTSNTETMVTGDVTSRNPSTSSTSEQPVTTSTKTATSENTKVTFRESISPKIIIFTTPSKVTRSTDFPPSSPNGNVTTARRSSTTSVLDDLTTHTANERSETPSSSVPTFVPEKNTSETITIKTTELTTAVSSKSSPVTPSTTVGPSSASPTSSPATSKTIAISTETSLKRSSSTYSISKPRTLVSAITSTPMITTLSSRESTMEITTVGKVVTTPGPCDIFGDPNCMPDKVLCPEQFGLFPHPSSKRIFIHCDHWRPYVKDCPSDLHFDPKLQVCSWPK